MTKFVTNVFIALASLLMVNAATEVLRPRGVPLSKKAFYDPGKEFQCLDGSATLPFLLVNDDYCDCDDGSDEPGTSACSNGLFHCSNIGYLEKIIPSSRVNDGICDCCDASDEYNSSAQCPNNCIELGEQMRVERERYLELLRQGNEIRQRYIEEAKQRFGDTRKELETLGAQLVQAEEEKKSKNELKNRAEELEKEVLDKHHAEEEKLRKQRAEEEQAAREAEEHAIALDVFKTLDTNSDGVLSYQELKFNLKFDQDADGIVSDNEARFFLNAAEHVEQKDYFETSWPLIKPAWEKAEPPQQPEQSDPSSHDQEVSDHDVTDSDATTEAYETEDDYQPNESDEGLPPVPPTPTEASPVTLEYDETTSQLVEEAKKAREDYSAAEGRFLDLQNKIRELEVLLESDYGSNGEYMSLKGQCFELTDNEYIYKLCPFDQASQRSKNGGSETNLGRWGKWIGPENNRYERFIMEGGVQCWNGPVRSVIVHVSCGIENQLIRAWEPNRCEYAYEFKTPAACVLSVGSAPDDSNEHQPVHTEL